MFCDQLKKTMSLLDVTGKQLAAYVGCDPSGISRMASGGRVPARTGKTAKKLVEGIYEYARETGRMEALRQLTGCEDEEPEGMREALASYLYGNTEPSARDSRQAMKMEEDRVFGERFDALMNISSFSNVHFARLVNMDASYISRFRSGLRTAKSSPENVDRICRVFLERIQKNDRIDELSHITGIDERSLFSEEASGLLSDWLCGKPDDSNIHKLQSLIKDIITLDDGTDQMPGEEISYEICDCYIGTEKFRMACLRLLTEALTDGTTDMYFYDDASTAWIDKDAVFRRKWKFCMRKCLAKGIRMHVIHHIDRDMDVLLKAINDWLPLYMSGLIDSYYCIRENSRRFSHTLFLSDKAVVEGNHVSGYKKDRMFRYHTDPLEVKIFHDQFYALKEQCRELVRSHIGLREPLQFESHVKVVRYTLSIATMPWETLEKVMDRNQVKGEDREKVRKEWQSISNMFDRAVAAGTFEEYSILDPGMNLDILCMPLKYDIETYREHMEEVIRRLKKYPGYRFFAIPGGLLKDSRMGLTEHTMVVTRLKQPTLTFYLSHPRMIQAFKVYIESTTKEEYTGEKLERYLASATNE